MTRAATRISGRALADSSTAHLQLGALNLTHIHVAWHGCRFQSSAIRVGRAAARRRRRPGVRLEWALLEAAMLSWLFRILMLAADR